jgi:hypothetical protein
VELESLKYGDSIPTGLELGEQLNRKHEERYTPIIKHLG